VLFILPVEHPSHISQCKMSGKVTELFRQQRRSRSGKDLATADPTSDGTAVSSRGLISVPDPEEVELVLRQFDFNTTFGPAMGISRLERWERASKLNLNPPQEVKVLILTCGVESIHNKNVWEHPI
jgi:DNA polymerase delta subunit 4